jgi:hypothetical protein
MRGQELLRFRLAMVMKELLDLDAKAWVVDSGLLQKSRA